MVVVVVMEWKRFERAGREENIYGGRKARASVGVTETTRLSRSPPTVKPWRPMGARAIQLSSEWRQPLRGSTIPSQTRHSNVTSGAP